MQVSNTFAPMRCFFLFSDNHGYMGEELFKYARLADEIWHAGDWLNTDLILALEN